MRLRFWLVLLALLLPLSGCIRYEYDLCDDPMPHPDCAALDGGEVEEDGGADAGAPDAGAPDAGSDAAPPDAGDPTDAAPPDA